MKIAVILKSTMSMIKPSKVTRRERADLMAVELANSELK